jgi:hypothetical protein
MLPERGNSNLMLIVRITGRGRPRDLEQLRPYAQKRWPQPAFQAARTLRLPPSWLLEVLEAEQLQLAQYEV